MSLELLKERFGHSGVTKEVDNKEKIHEKLSTRFTYKKDADNEEKIHEKLNAQFNDMGDFKNIKVQHQEQLDEKQRIIENFKIETSELANEVATLKKDKAVLLDNLNKSKWMEDKVHSTAKQIYEDKIKTMSYVDSTELIPLLISVSREKQGNTRLNWGNWLKISENKYLFQINESLAKRVFEDTNVLIDRAIGFINRKRTRGGDIVEAVDYVLTFTGDTAADAREDYVSTLFNPDSYDGAGTGLNAGFTVSYWVKPLEVTGDVFFAFGKRSQRDGRFEFGIKNKNKIKVGIGGASKDDNDDSHGMEVGTWYNFVVTYGGTWTFGDAQVRVYLNGTELLKTGASGGGMGTAAWVPGKQNCDEGCDDPANAASYLYFGGRSAFQDLDNPYNQGWACSLSEVAIYNVEKDEDGTFANEVYNAGWGYNHSGNSGLVGYWKFNEGSGTTIKDYGPYEKHGTLTSDAENGTGIPSWTKNESYE